MTLQETGTQASDSVPDFDFLFRGPLQHYIAELAQCRKSPIVYAHLPKAAGTASVASLKPHFQRVIQMPWDQTAEITRNIIAAGRKNAPDLISGHLHYEQLAGLQAALSASLVTFLRHPVERLVSNYRYSITPVNPPHAEFRKQFPTFQAYAESVPPNVIAGILIGGAMSLPDYIHKAKKMYSFIGCYDAFATSSAILSAGLTGRTILPGRVNVTQKTAENDIQIGAQTNKLLGETQALDIMFYAYLKHNFCQLMDRELSTRLAEVAYAAPSAKSA